MKIVIDIPEEVYSFIKSRGHIPYAVNIANEIVNGTPYEERPTGEWISVSERLPDEDGFYLCTFYNGDFVEVGELWYFDILGKFETIYYTNDYKVIAWMPLPEPYKEEEDENT